MDQEASLNLAEISRGLAGVFGRLRPELVLEHPFEGGHPDHDTTAFAVHAACRLVAPERRPELVEFTSYHGRGGQIETGFFCRIMGRPRSSAYSIEKSGLASCGCWLVTEASRRCCESSERRKNASGVLRHTISGSRLIQADCITSSFRGV